MGDKDHDDAQVKPDGQKPADKHVRSEKTKTEDVTKAGRDIDPNAGSD